MAAKIELKIKPIYLWNIYILLAFALILALGFSFLVYNNYTVEHYEKLNTIRLEEVDLKAKLVEKHALVKSVPLYVEKINELNQLESSVNKEFPDSDEIPNMLIQINQMAEDKDVAISNILPSVGEKYLTDSDVNDASGGVKILTKTFNLTASSAPDDFIDFVYELAKYPRVIQVRDVKINRVDDNKVDISMILTIFYVK